MRSRSLLAVVALLVAGMAFTAGIRSGRVNAQDDATLTAAVVSGSCDSPGDVAGELRDLAPAEGGVLTSFTRIDLAIDELTGGDYAVVVSSNGDTVACGDISGNAQDVYVPVVATSDAGYSGIAWLHARDPQTQVSLFVAQGLGGSASSNNGTVEPPSDETPQPPSEDTPTPKAQVKPTRTPKAKASPTQESTGEVTTYKSPTYGYTMDYDATWTNVEESTNPTDNGPQDFLHLFNGASHALLFSNAADDNLPMDQVPDIMQGRLESDSTVSNVEVRTDDNGDEIKSSDDDSAIVAFNFTWTSQNGQTVDLYDYYHVYRLPGQQAVVIFLNEGPQQAYDQQGPVREKLENSITIPS
ncbi:MAG TPA: hypothetical protein VH482_31875 [Thermomicrobiales bacterium]|jgi:hypothetical protein